MGAGKTKVLLAIAMVIVATLSLVEPTLGAVAPGRAYRATLSIGYAQKSDQFQGNLHTAPICERGRVASVYEARPGSDRLVGRGKTDRQGDYAVGNPAGLTGSFYARTRVTRRGEEGDHLCKGARSETVRITKP
jgi:hypothetical protein